jgi:hypothetical protein
LDIRLLEKVCAFLFSKNERIALEDVELFIERIGNGMIAVNQPLPGGIGFGAKWVCE